MRRYNTQALKNAYDFKLDSIRKQELAIAIHAVRLSIVKDKSVKLHDKETTCCNRATD